MGACREDVRLSPGGDYYICDTCGRIGAEIAGCDAPPERRRKENGGRWKMVIVIGCAILFGLFICSRW